MTSIAITKRSALEGDLLERAWRLYLHAFEELRATAVQRHVMTRAEFDAVMADPRVDVYVAEDERAGRMCALATFSNRVEAMPLVSPEFFEARWPEHYAAGRCWCIGFVAVHPDYHGTGVFADVVGDMTLVVGEHGGVAVLDVCSRNSDVYRLPAAILRVAQSHVPEVVAEVVDTQAYWAYQAPVPAQPGAVDGSPRVTDLRHPLLRRSLVSTA